MKNLARLSFLLVTILWGSFYAVAKEALQRLDPIIFTFFEVASLVPIALALVIIHRKELNAVTLKRGILLGSWQCLALLTVTTAEQFTTATCTAFFPGIGGVIGALATGLFLKHPVKKATWMACVSSLGGTCIILATSGGGLAIRGNIIAFLGAIFFTTYFFFVDHDHQKYDGHGMWSVIGIEHLTIVFWMALITLLFGNWQHVHPELPKDIVVIIYVGGICTFLPIVLINFMQRYIPPLEVAFISILEPIWGIIMAHLYLEEVVPHSIYLGGALIVVAAFLHIWITSGKNIRIKKATHWGLWRTMPSDSVKRIIRMEQSFEIILVKSDQQLCGWQALSQVTEQLRERNKMINTLKLKSVPFQPLSDDTTVVEIARLVNKAHLLIQALGGLLPGLKLESIQQITSVLDIACGPGIWTLEFARKQPQIAVVGVDTNGPMIAYARRISQQQAMGNAAYHTIPSFVEPFPFAEASFDLINMQFLGKFVKKDDWPHLLCACWRLLRPGGLIRLTEFAGDLVSSPAHEKLNRLFMHAMCLAGRYFLPPCRLSDVQYDLEPLLHRASFYKCFNVAHTINYSYGAPLHEEWKRDYLILSREVQPLIIQMGLATQKQVDALHQQQHYEMNIPTFHAFLPMLTVWGQKRNALQS